MRRLLRTRSVLALLALVTLLSTAGVAVGASSAVAACTGSGCNGQDPNVNGCSSGAYDLDDTTYSYIRVELRYSPTCKAVWTRLTSLQTCTVYPQYRLPIAQTRVYSSSSSPWDSPIARWSGAPSGCGNGYVWWSPMAGPFSSYWFRACEANPNDYSVFNCSGVH
jgi:hypothetical protein